MLRDNMAFGHAGLKEFGTYFIGYSRSPRTIEEMLQNMFVGKPTGNYDQLLDFSRAVTGNLFFVPSATFLENVKAGEAETLARKSLFGAGLCFCNLQFPVPRLRVRFERSEKIG